MYKCVNWTQIQFTQGRRSIVDFLCYDIMLCYIVRTNSRKSRSRNINCQFNGRVRRSHARWPSQDLQQMCRVYTRVTRSTTVDESTLRPALAITEGTSRTHARTSVFLTYSSFSIMFAF